MSIGDRNQELEASTMLGNQQEYQIEFEFEGRRGIFVFRRPSLKTRLAIGAMEANLLGGAPRQSCDLTTLNIARILSTFSYVLAESPPWFNLDLEDDYEFAEALYLEYTKVVKPFRSRSDQGTKQNEGVRKKVGGKDQMADS